MKRYIRTKDGKVYDAISYAREIELLQKLHPTENIDNFLDTDNIVESDDIEDLIQVGDLVRIEFTSDDYAFSKGTITLSEVASEDELYDLVSGLECESLGLLELYVKRGDNYVLVWDSERGII